MLSRFFQLNKHHTTGWIECRAGLTTFLAMSYIILINPSILSLSGMDKGAVFTATCLAAAFGSLMMGLMANYPIALAPGMALNTYFTYGVVLGAGYSWQVALGAVFLSGLIFLTLSISPIRAYLVNSIPKTLKVAIVAGIGLFLGLIGFKSAGIIVANPTTLVAIGNLHEPRTVLAMMGLFLMISLDALEVSSGIIISILMITLASILLGYNQFGGIFSLPPSIIPTFLQMDIQGAFSLGLTTIIFAFLFVDLFDNTGTLIGIAHRAGLMDAGGKLPRINRVLLADSMAAIASAILGTSTTTSYLESTVGVKSGGRTGLVAVVVGLLFLASLFLSPLATAVPLYATAPALIYVSCLMSRAFTEINWEDATDYAPSVITAITMPLTFSIAEGISLGFITYTAVKLATGRFRELNWAMGVLSAVFVGKYVFLG